ncbi:unnamed protein product, partial [Polarella glacialis]
AQIARQEQDERKRRGLPYPPPLTSKQTTKIRSSIKSASYTGPQGQDLEVLFRRLDLDDSGELEHEEIHRALRRTLKIPPHIVYDHEISALCAMMDPDYSGTVNIEELMTFVYGKAG